jgi:hypothetical protein
MEAMSIKRACLRAQLALKQSLRQRAPSPHITVATRRLRVIETLLPYCQHRRLACIGQGRARHAKPQLHGGNTTNSSGKNVETKLWNHALRGSLIVAIIALAGCGTPAARNFGGSWKSVNHFQRQPIEIPLTAAYTFYAAPMDETLKSMLTRWARDSGRELSYQLPYDVTLYTPVSSIHTTDLDSAARQLTTIYATQYVYVSATDRKILVRPASTISSVADENSALAAPASIEAPAKTAEIK